MSKRQHQKQVERARAARRADRFERRRRRARYTAIAAVVALGLSVFAVALLNVIDREPDPDELGADDEPQGTCSPADDVPEVDAEQYDEPPPLEIDEDASYLATVDTTCGRIVIELDPAGAPTATNNFVFLARAGFYDGVIFHRVIEDFMIQGGDPEGTGTGGPGYTFEDELGPAQEAFEQVRQELREQLEQEGRLEPDGDIAPDAVPGGYPRGVLAMANSGPDTNGSQFFITRNDPAILPGPDYTLFGEVVEGMEVVDLIATEPTDAQDRPLEPVHILAIEIDER